MRRLPRFRVKVADNHSLAASHPIFCLSAGNLTMADPTRILFVDDEPGIRATLPAILDRFGFNVTAAATVSEALRYVATEKFDVLIADLNIGQPGDGFTVVSAMRRTQPGAVTFILTGYPAFESALEAIRQQVDEYLIKPADIDSMVEKIRLKLADPRGSGRQIQTKRLPEILEQSKRDIVQRWLTAARKDDLIAAANLSDFELTEHLPTLIGEVIKAPGGQTLSREALDAAAAHGRERFKHGCTIPALMRECRILQQVLSKFIQNSLLGLDISSVIPGVMQIGEAIQAYYEACVREYVHARYTSAEAVQNKGKSLLLLSGDTELALLRAHALKQAGFFVSRADNRKEALELLEQKFDALVVSYSLSGENITEMTELFRQQNPTAPIVAVSREKWQDLKVDADFQLRGEDGPEALIEAVDSVLNRKQLRRIK
jgi:DNA-binding response OmpR family regulator